MSEDRTAAEMRFAKIEATQRETSELLEQLLITMLADRQIPRAMEEMQGLLASELSEQAHASNSNQSNRTAILESAPRTGKMG